MAQRLFDAEVFFDAIRRKLAVPTWVTIHVFALTPRYLNGFGNARVLYRWEVRVPIEEWMLTSERHTVPRPEPGGCGA